MPKRGDLGTKCLKTSDKFEISTFKIGYMRNFVKIRRSILFGLGHLARNLKSENYLKITDFPKFKILGRFRQFRNFFGSFRVVSARFGLFRVVLARFGFYWVRLVFINNLILRVSIGFEKCELSIPKKTLNLFVTIYPANI